MAEQEKWKWQEPGMAWKGVGLYHVTLTVIDRKPLLGALSIPDNDPMKARVNRTALGNALVDCLLSIPTHHPEVQVLLHEQRPFIVLADNGFRDFYKPIDSLFDACATGRVLILSPWPYDANKRNISRMECVALNEMAEEICQVLSKNEDVPKQTHPHR